MSNGQWAWIEGHSFRATRWRAWLKRYGAPHLEEWAQSAESVDPLTEKPSKRFCVPVPVPPSAPSERELSELFDDIRRRQRMIENSNREVA